MEKFNQEANGYSKSEVNKFVNDVITQTEGLISKYKFQITEINTLKEEVDKLNEKLKYYQNIESTLKNEIIKHKDYQETIKNQMQEEADSIIKEAKHNSSRIVNEALLRADKIQMRTDQLESNMKIYKRKMKLLIEQQQAVYEEIEVLEL